MGASIEHQLICRIIELQDFHTVEKLKIDETYFLGDANIISQPREAFKFIREHFHNEQTYGSIPSWQILQTRVPGFPWTPSWDAIPTLCQELRRLKLRAQVFHLTDELSRTADLDPMKALSTIREAAATLVAQHEMSNDLMVSNAYEKLYQEYQMVAQGHGILGIPWPWDILNEDTQGIQNGQFIVIYGRPKSMKCVVAGQKIMMKDGSLVPIEEVPEETIVPSYTESTGKIRWATARRVVSGVKDCVEVQTRSGLRLRTSTEHLYMVPGGNYKRICDLRPGDYIATARKLPEWDVSSSLNEKEICKFGVESLVRQRKEHGSDKVEIPSEIFQCSKQTIATYIAELLDIYGQIDPEEGATWISPSRKFLEGIQHLLSRFGVHSVIREEPNTAWIYRLNVNALKDNSILNKQQNNHKEAEAEIIWEQIEIITPIGEHPCYDICIADGLDPNFVVENLIVHNSWLALYVATQAYLRGMRVLVYSLEMSPIQLLRRIAAIICQVDYEKFKNGKLDPTTQQQIWGILYWLKDQEISKTNEYGHSASLLATQPLGEASGVSQLHAKIREFNPDLVVVDGMYLMRDDRGKARTIDWKSIAHISQDLKKTAQLFNIPIMGITQANRAADKDPKKADLAELAYADAIAQDCDICIRVHKQKDGSSGEPELVLSIPGSREGKLDAFVIHGIPAVNFHYKRATITDPNHPQATEQKSGGSNHNGVPKGQAIVPTNWRIE